MKDHASFTAAWVAGCRSLALTLPEEARLADDPYGARFAPPGMAALLRMPAVARRALRPFVIYMQVRTRVLDDAMLDFVRAGGDQVVLLGAGFDCRALRFAHELARSTVFEVDHPATQARKRASLEGDIGAHTEYVAWNFENRRVGELPAALAARGLDPSKPTVTLWEGVTMYLTEDAIDACVRAVADYSAAGSLLAFTYFERSIIDHPTPSQRVARRFVALVGEPFRFGWVPSALPAWMRQRGFEIVRDASAVEYSRELLPARYVLGENAAGRHIAVARRI